MRFTRCKRDSCVVSNSQWSFKPDPSFSRIALRQMLTLVKGPVEVDEAYLGDKQKNKLADKRRDVGGDSGGKTSVAVVPRSLPHS